VLGVLLHVLVIRPVLNSEPINQLLVTGGVLFFLQAAATLAFGVQFRNLGLSLPSLQLGEIYLPYSRIFAALTAFVADDAALFLPQEDLSRDRDPGDQPGPRDHAVDGREPGADLHRHLRDRRRARRARSVPARPAVRRAPGDRALVRSDHLPDLRPRRPRNMVGGFVAAFIFAQLISLGGFFFHIEWGYVMAFLFFIVMMFVRPQGLLGKKA